MKRDIFRLEAIEYQSASSLGTIFIARPLGLDVMCGVLFAFFVGFLVFVYTASYTSKETVKGLILPSKGVARITAPSPGTVTRLYVKEGQLVQKDELLGEILIDPSGKSTDVAQAGISQAIEERLALAKDEIGRRKLTQDAARAGLSDKIAGIEQELATLDKEIAIQKENVELAKGGLRRFDELHQKGFISFEGTSNKRTQYQEAAARLESLTRERIRLLRDLTAARHDLAALPMRDATELSDAIRTELQEKQSLLESERKRVIKIWAPETGKVTGINFPEGQSVGMGKVLLSIVPVGSKYQAHLFVPSKSAAFIRRDALTYLRLDAFPYQRFGTLRSRVETVSMATILPDEMTELGMPAELSNGKAVYRVVADIAAESDRIPLENIRPGMQFEADVTMDTQKIYKWLLSPIFGIQNKNR